MICIKTFANPFDAEVARRTLEAHGLEARLSSDTEVGGDMVPGGFGGVRLFVADGDNEQAVDILTGGTAAAASGVEEDPSVGPVRHPAKRIIAGILWTSVGIAVTVGTYKLTAPNGAFIIAYGAVGYGLYELARGVVEALSVEDPRKTAPRNANGD